jgi:hypothetical protein
MQIEVFLLCWNEADIIKLVVKHYQSFCDKITILDNHSTDKSIEIAKSMGCHVIKFGDHTFNDQHNLEIKNTCWQGSQFDYVIVADMDEVLYSPYGAWNIIKSEPSATIFKTIGWQIMSNDMPVDDLTEVLNGYRFDNYSKNILFSPKHIQEINYNPGAHRINPIGDVRYSEESLYVLHYKHIGGIERTIQRYNDYKPRMSRANRKNGWGVHYNRSIPSLHEEWNQRMAISKPLI